MLVLQFFAEKNVLRVLLAVFLISLVPPFLARLGKDAGMAEAVEYLASFRWADAKGLAESC